MELPTKEIHNRSVVCMRDRPDCPALLFCRVRADPGDRNLYAKFFRCSECKREVFEGSSFRERMENGLLLVMHGGDFSGPIHKECPLITQSPIDIRVISQSPIDICVDCRVDEVDKSVSRRITIKRSGND
jgi:hypothetical protein